MRDGRAKSHTTARRLLGGGAALPYLSSASGAHAFALSDLPALLGDDSLRQIALYVAIAYFIWSLIAVRKLARASRSSGKKVADLEAQLNDAEAALAAEPHVLVVWRGRDGKADRVIGGMRGAARVPAAAAALENFAGWLERESAEALSAAVLAMRAEGKPFNLGVRTIENELIEADGRTAGGLATLRLRPLAGDRRELADLAYDARRLGKQVERLSAVLDSAPWPIWLKDADGKLIWANRAYIRAVEAADIDAVTGNNIALFDATKLDRAAPLPGATGRSHAVIGGAKRALDIFDVLLPDGSAGFASDVTALETAQKELKRHIEAHASTLDKLDTAIAIFGPDQRLRFHNAAYAKLWSFDPDWLSTSPSDGEILDRLRGARMLQEQANYRDWRARQLQAYTTLEVKDDWWHLPDGRTVHVVCEQHPFGGVTYLYENATNEIQLQSALNEITGVQRETLDNLHEGVALIGTDGRLRLHNPAFANFWGLDKAFLDKKPHIDLIIAQARRLLDDGLHWDEVKYGVTGLDASRKELKGRVPRPDGRVFDFASAPLPDGNTLLTYVDVTDNFRMENALRERAEALEAADRLKTGFMSNVSYQLRTPLTNIIGYSEALTLGIAGELQTKQADYLHDIQVSSQELLAIINAILDLTTIDAGAMELTFAEVDVAKVLGDAAKGVGDWVAKRDMTLSIEIAEDVSTFTGDFGRVKQVLHNLLTNAIGFSAKGATVRMGAKRDGQDILLWVADQGRGIDPEFQKKAFDRFQAKSVPGGHRGPGLGLAIVKSFVELHGGQVSLLSRLEKGTTVICRMPLRGPKPVSEAAVA
jgi:signal transduction histidine kinase